MRTCHKLLLLFAVLLWAEHGFAQSIDTVKLNFIKRQFAEINRNLKSCKKVEKEDTVETTEGNGVLLYYSGKEIKKIAATYFGETGKAVQEYYFADNKLIFCYCVDYHYNMPISEKGGGKIRSTTEERFYLSDCKVFLLKKKPAVSEYFSEFPDDPVKEAKRLMSLK